MAAAKSFKVLFIIAVTIYVSHLTAQELLSRNSFGIQGTFSPDSSHILIGRADQRRTWTAGFEYGRTVLSRSSVRLDYEGSITPFFQERDPTITGAYFMLNGYPQSVAVPTGRVLDTGGTPIGYVLIGGPPIPIYGTYSSKKSYAFAVSPLGARISGFNSHKIQPTFSADLGVVFSSRDLPIDDSAKFNYLVSFGPGIEFFYRPNESVRLEYLYRHMSNAGSGESNPGVDQGVFRLTLSRRR